MTSSPTRTPRPRRRRALLVLLAPALALGAAGGTVLLLDDGDERTEDAERADETTGEPEDERPDEADVDEPARDTVGDPYAPDSGATGYDVTHYDIALRYDPEDGAIDGVTTITATATTDLATFSVDLVDLEIERAIVDGEEAEVETDGRDVTIVGPELIDAGDEFETELAYSGVPEPVVSAGFPTGWLDTDDGGAYVIGEPDGAATWFPSNDHPSDKASLAIEVNVPRGWAAAANGAFEGRSREGRRLVWRWREDDPIATYLVTVAIDRFRMVEDETDDGLPLVSFYPEQDADRLEQAFADTEAMIEVFEDRFGPYPFDEYGAIVVPEVLGLALETQTRSIFGIDVAEIEVFRAHELAHQWFGDSLTLRRWADIWLNEGFATYAELLWSEASDDDYDIDRDAASRRDTLVGFDEEPILDPGVDRWFSEAVYQRGALTLHALRRTVGDDDFFEILRRWAEDHRHGTVTTDEFVALAEEVGGEDLVELFDAWLRDDEIPELP